MLHGRFNAPVEGARSECPSTPCNNGCQCRCTSSRCPRLSKRQLPAAPRSGPRSAGSDALCPHGRVGFRAPRCACRHPRPIRAAHPSAGRRGLADPRWSNRSIPRSGAAGPVPRRELEKEAGSLRLPPLPHVAGSLETRWLPGDARTGRAGGTTVLRAQIFPPGPTQDAAAGPALLLRSHRGRRVASRAPARACGTGRRSLTCGVLGRAPMSGAGGCPRSTGQRAGSGRGARAGQLVRALRVLTASCSAWGSWALGSPAGTESSAPALDGAAAGCALGPWGY